MNFVVTINGKSIRIGYQKKVCRFSVHFHLRYENQSWSVVPYYGQGTEWIDNLTRQIAQVSTFLVT